mgnify:CR=1 FL=1
MTYEEEVIKSRAELKHLRQENARFKNAHNKLHEKITHLEQENRLIKEGNRLLKQGQQILKETIQQQQKQLESLKLIVEELRRMIFGKKKKKTDKKEGDDESASNTSESTAPTEGKKKRKAANRSAESYRRPTPSEGEITSTHEHTLTHCPDCGTMLIGLKTIVRYIEDIADVTELDKVLKKVEQHLIGSGYCPACKKRKLAKPVSPQASILGENVKKMIVYLTIIMRHSFEQVHSFFKDTANISISDGEIVTALDEQSEKLTPEQARLFQKMRASPGRHYDETGWKVQKGGQGNYCWITRPTEGEETIFLMGRSRGKGVAEELRGEADEQVGISDDYAAYDNLFGEKRHQLCMAHPHRKLRDLTETNTLTGKKKAACDTAYQAFKQLYKAVEETLATTYDKGKWLQKREGYLKQLKVLAKITKEDPGKLQAIKRALTQNAEKYFTCLQQQGIPADNNKAERGLRHIVLKRKISYGSKTQKGADTMSILSSTLLSCWWNKPKNFFVAYNQMLTA